MTPDKPRRPATPASKGPTRAAPAPKVPKVAAPPPVPLPPAPGRVRGPDGATAPPDARVRNELKTARVPPAETKDSTREAPDASGDSAPPAETGHVDAEDRATTKAPRRPLALYPLPVWPD